MESYIIKGILSHKRFGISSSSFNFRHTMLMLDSNVFVSDQKLPSLISVDKIGFLSLNQKKLINNTNKDVKKKIRDIFELKEDTSNGTNSFVVTTPSVLGYSFNPASFYFVLSENNAIKYCAVEVHNTFNESHIYKLNRPSENTGKTTKFLQEKKFHVSPFIARTGDYEFEFKLCPSYLKISITLFQNDNPVLSMLYLGELIPLTQKALILNIFPLLSTVLLTEYRILKRAYKLNFIEKLPFFKKPPPLPETRRALSRGLISKLKIPFL